MMRTIAASLAICMVVLVVSMAALGVFTEGTPESRRAREEARRVNAKVVAARPAESFRETFAAFRSAIGLCDAGSSTLNQIDKLSVVDAYGRIRDAHEDCKRGWLSVSRLEPEDDVSEAARPATEKAIEVCGTAYYLKQRALEKAMGVLDGDGRPSAVLAVKEDMGAAQVGVLQCVAGWFAAAEKAGVKLGKDDWGTAGAP